MEQGPQGNGLFILDAFELKELVNNLLVFYFSPENIQWDPLKY